MRAISEFTIENYRDEEIFSLRDVSSNLRIGKILEDDADVFPEMDDNPNSDASSLTTQLLTDNGYTNINQINLSKYKIVIEANYVVNSNNIETVLIQNKTDIQILINIKTQHPPLEIMI